MMNRLLLGIKKGYKKSADTFESSNALLLSLLVVGISIGLVLFFFRINYETNDDALMASISSGQYGGTPSEYLVFTNIIIGLLLKALYTITPDVYWYPIYLILCHFCSLLAVFYALAQLFEKRQNALLAYLMLFFSVELYLLQFLQFTTTAGLAGVAGILLLLSNPNKSKLFHLNGQSIMGIALLILSGLIRLEVLQELLILSIPLLIYEWLIRRRYLLFEYVIVGGLSFLAVMFNDHYYSQDAEWKYYQEITHVRVDLIDLRYFDMADEEVQHILEEVGWDEDDYFLAKRFMFEVSEAYSLEKLAKLLDGVKQLRWHSLLNFSNFRRMIAVGVKILFPRFVLAFLLVGLFYFLDRKSSKLMLGVCVLCWTFAVLLLLDLWGLLLQERVINIGLLFVLAILFYGMADLLFTKKYISISLLVVAMSLALFRAQNGAVQIDFAQAKKTRSLIDQQMGKNLGVVFLDTYDVRFLSPFSNGHFPYHHYVLGWACGMPLNQDKLQKHLESNTNKKVNAFTQAKYLTWIFRHGAQQSDLKAMEIIARKYHPELLDNVKKLPLNESEQLWVIDGP